MARGPLALTSGVVPWVVGVGPGQMMGTLTGAAACGAMAGNSGPTTVISLTVTAGPAAVALPRVGWKDL